VTLNLYCNENRYRFFRVTSPVTHDPPTLQVERKRFRVPWQVEHLADDLSRLSVAPGGRTLLGLDGLVGHLDPARLVDAQFAHGREEGLSPRNT